MVMPLRFALIVIVGFALIRTAPARGEQPATAPAQAPATAPASEPAAATAHVASEVKAALKAYNAAMRAGDIDGMLALAHTTNEDEARFAKAIARADAHVAKLLSAAHERFGADARAKVGDAIDDADDDDIDAATVLAEGDRAAIAFQSGGSAPMVRIDGTWKVNSGRFLQELGPVDDAIDSFNRRGNFAKVVAQDVAAGKYKTLDELLERIRKHETGQDEPVPN
jgi:hypothetical protein